MKHNVKKILIVLLSLFVMLSFASCGDADTTSQGGSEKTKTAEQTTADNNDNGEKKNANENEDKAGVQPSSKRVGNVIKVDVPSSRFCGTWTAESGKAEYLYGSLEITLEKDGTWTGDITGESLHGTWKEADYGVHLKDVVLDWECDLYYTANENFVLDEDGMQVVLTRQD